MIHLFTPVQPEWNQKLSYITSCKTSALFQNSIAYVYEFKITSTNESSVDLLGIPDGCLDLIFNMNGDLSDCHLVPSPKIRHALSFQTNTTYFGIRLFPLQTIFQFNVSLQELNTFKYLPLFEVNPQLIFLYDLLLEQQTLQGCREALESFLISKDFSQCPSKIIDFCIQLAVCNKGNIHVKQLEQQTCYSERYLRKLFAKEVGISPKAFLEMIYFQYTLQEMLTGDFDVNEHLSTYDLVDTSHFYKKFKKLTNLTPIQYQKLLFTEKSLE